MESSEPMPERPYRIGNSEDSTLQQYWGQWVPSGKSFRF